MKYYKELCELLGIEPGKIYEMDECCKEIKIDKDGLHWRRSHKEPDIWYTEHWRSEDSNFVHGLIEGKIKLINE